MGVTKTAGFSETQNKRAQFFKVLGHPARLAILEHLIEKQACICNDLVEELPLSQSTISQHLRELKDAGIIKGEIEGNSLCYCINEQVWKELDLDIQAFFQRFQPIPKCC